MNKEKILETISNELGISIDDIMGKCRNHDLVIARHLAFMFLHDDCNMSNCAIARMFKQTPSSVLKSRRAYKWLIEIGNKEYTTYYQKIDKILHNS